MRDKVVSKKLEFAIFKVVDVKRGLVGPAHTLSRQDKAAELGFETPYNEKLLTVEQLKQLNDAIFQDFKDFLAKSETALFAVYDVQKISDDGIRQRAVFVLYSHMGLPARVCSRLYCVCSCVVR